MVLITNRVFQIESEDENVEVKNNKENKNVEVENVKVQDKQIFDRTQFKLPRVFTREHNNNVLEEPVEYSDDEIIEEPIFENIIDPIDEIVVDEETGEIQLPEEPLEIKQEVFLSSPQVEEETISIEEETYLPKGKITLEDIKEIKDRNRGFSVDIPEPKRNNFIQRISGRK